MKVVDLIKRLQSYPMDAYVTIKNDKLRIIEANSCDCSPTYLSLEDTVSKKSELSEQERNAVLEAVNLLHNACKDTNCLDCVLASDSGDCILLMTSPDKWGLQIVEQNCKGE